MAPRKAKTIEPETVEVESEHIRVEETRVVERGEPSGTNDKLDLILTQLAGVNQTIAHMDGRLNHLEQRRNPPRSHSSSYYRRNEPIGAVSETFLGDARRSSLGGLGVEPPRAHTHDPHHDPIIPQNICQNVHPQLTNGTNGEPIQAIEWYCFWEEDFPNATWDFFKEELLPRFGDTTYVNYEIELRNLKQTSMVQDYQTKFERLSSMVKNRPVESKIAHFIGGLNEDIQIEMLRDPPTQLRRCFALAKVIEEQFRRRDAQKKVHKPGFVAKPNTNVGMSLEMQKTPFTIDLYLLPIGGVDLVLGIQWMKPLKRTLLDWENMTLTFPKEGGGEITLEAINPNVDPKPALRFLIANQPAFWLVSMLKDVIPSTTEVEERPAEIQRVLDRYHMVFEEPKGLPPTRSYDHHITLVQGVEAVNVRPYRYAYSQKVEIKKLVKEMLESGVIRPSNSPFSSFVLLVKKKDGTWRFCVDYWALNEVTVKDKHPIPFIDELLGELTGASYFSKMDLRAGYHQIRMQREDVHKTAFRTHDGHYEFLVMPFGLTNAPATFQRCMNDLFRSYLRDYVLVFFDDILVYSPTLEMHARHLDTVLSILRDNKLYAKMSKCTFGQTSVGYLGHIVSRDGVRAEPEKLVAIEQWPLPKNLKEMRGFLGLTGYYRCFISGYGSIASPLTHMLKNGPFQWTDKSREAFTQLKAALMSAPVLALPDFEKEFTVETNASDVGVGAVLSEEGHPIAFMSKALTKRAKPLSTYEKELLAMVLAVDKWRPYLLGCKFLVRIDHNSLKYMVN
ncbi:Retrovirus-related Pol polyprotein from transposon 297 [Nymphaea thermarum]|nr:Retrovirus-related Pol polyprotein from transposon 297 [Nymphaea thermarum]